MSRRVCLWTFGVLAAWLALGARAVAVAPEIRDEGKFFSPEAVKKANEQIRDIYSKHGKDVLIETFASVPPDQLAKVEAMNAKEKEAFFHKQAVSRAKERVVKGIYILITKQPKYLYVELTPQAGPDLDLQTRNHLRQILISNFQEDQFNEGLAGVVAAVQEKLARKAPK
jgi:uncharacterized membrane protein YgcG